MNVTISVISKVGGRKRNEDACGYWQTESKTCCVLSDGAGGHGGGDIASQLSVETVIHAFQQRSEVSPDQAMAMLHRANQEVIRHQTPETVQQDMRATLVILLFDIDTTQATWGHIGDSRLYFFRGGNRITQTRDHSVFQSMVDAGFVTLDQARSTSQRTVLTGSLGGDDGFTPEVLGSAQDLRLGDAFLLCSDGFWEYVSEAEMEKSLQLSQSPQDWLDRMESTILSQKRAGHDNYSAIAVWIGQMEFATQLVSRVGQRP